MCWTVETSSWSACYCLNYGSWEKFARSLPPGKDSLIATAPLNSACVALMAVTNTALWGSYNYGNFGDDLMAVAFARHLKAVGAAPRVFGFPEKLGVVHGFEVMQDVDSLISQSDLCIVGGGAWLASDVSRAPRATTKRQQEFLDFAKAIETHRCPTYLISIGSDGDQSSPHSISSARRRLFESGLCRYATVRLPNDGTILDHFGIPSRYFPDVLLDAGQLFSITRWSRDDGRFHVGLNLPRQTRLLGAIYTALAALRRKVCIHFIDTVQSEQRRTNLSSDFMPSLPLGLGECHAYEDPIKTLQFVAGLDLVITHKLHLGVTALSFDIPYLCVGGLGKCKAFLESVGAPTAYRRKPSGRREAIREACRLSSTAFARSAHRHFDFAGLKQLRKESHGHLEYVTTLVTGR